MIKKILLSIFILSTVAQGAYNHVVISVDSLPYTATERDSITFTGNLSTTGNALIISYDSIFVNFDGDTLEFGAESGGVYPDSTIGIIINGEAEFVTLKGGSLIHGGGTGAGDSSWNNTGILISNVQGVLLDSMNFELYGWNGRVVNGEDGDVYNLEISGCHFIHHLDGFTSRCAFDATTILVSGIYGAIDEGDYNLKLHDTVIDCWHGAVFTKGLNYIYDCSLLVDAKNDLYSYPSGQQCWTSGSAGGITFYGQFATESGSEIYDNIIVAGIDNEGMDNALSLSYVNGTAEDPVLVYNNLFKVNRGAEDYEGPPTEFFGGRTGKCFKSRWSNKHINYYNNDHYVYTHSDSGAHAAAYGLIGEAAEFTAVQDEGQFPDSFFAVYNNLFWSEALDDAEHVAQSAVGARIGLWDSTKLAGYNWRSAGNTWQNNAIHSSLIGYDVGQGDAGSASNFLAEGDSVYLINNGVFDSTDYITYEVGDFDGSCFNNGFRNLVYGDSVDPFKVNWDSPETGSHDMYLEREYEITVDDTLGNPIEDAIVWAINDYGDTAFIDTSNASGLATGIAKYFHAGDDFTDSTAYNDFTLKALLDTDSAEVTHTLAWDNYDTTIVLGTAVEAPAPSSGSLIGVLK